MLELSAVALTIVVCVDEARVLDALARNTGAHACRIAPDELWVLGAPSVRGSLLESARAGVAATGGIAEDQTDAWSAHAVGWPEAAAVFARLAAVPLPAERPALVQCELAHVAGKAIALVDYLCLLVPSPVGHHLEERILHGCGDLEPTKGPMLEFCVPGGALA